MKKRFWIIGLGIILVGVLYFGGMGKYLTASVFNQSDVIVLETNKGDITIQLLYDEAPNIAQNFYQLAQSGKYNGTIFHRVIDGFMIQGGDYENSNGTGGEAYGGGFLDDEFSQNLSHVRGAVSMANRGPNTNGSQFFIVQQDAQFLDGRHSIFGQITDGMDVVDTIAKSKTSFDDMPLEAVTVLRATIH